MTDQTITTDSTRSLLEITGQDATSFLQGIVTQDVAGMAPGETRFSALLSPQGKWLFDFFITKTDTGFLLDVLCETLPRLMQGLTLYKLKADVQFKERTDLALYYIDAAVALSQAHTDPRHTKLPKRLWQPADQPAPEGAISPHQYHETRLEHGVPEGGIDVTPQETAMDAGYDCLHAIHFEKGCYVGQEVTARMHYKAIARKGFYRVELPENTNTPDLPADITVNGKTVAELRSASGNNGLAFAKFDAVYKAQMANAPLMIGELSVSMTVPDWLAPKYDAFMANLSA